MGWEGARDGMGREGRGCMGCDVNWRVPGRRRRLKVDSNFQVQIQLECSLGRTVSKWISVQDHCWYLAVARRRHGTWIGARSLLSRSGLIQPRLQATSTADHQRSKQVYVGVDERTDCWFQNIQASQPCWENKGEGVPCLLKSRI